MKSVIFYFSGTGNNIYVAKKIAEGIDNTKIYPFKAIEEHRGELSNFERIFFCTPSYYSHIPNYVQKMIKSIAFTSRQKVYSIVVCGGNRGHAMEDLREVISESGGQVCGEYMVVLPGSYILSYGGFPKLVGNVENFFANRKINKIVKDVLHSRSPIMKKTGLFYKESEEPRLLKAIEAYGTIGSNYSVSEGCVGCGTCVKVCPVNNISIVDGKPIFEQNCQQCMACIQWCPTRAIDYEKKASKRRRYHHPQITVKDMMLGGKD